MSIAVDTDLTRLEQIVPGFGNSWATRLVVAAPHRRHFAARRRDDRAASAGEAPRASRRWT